MNNKRANTYKGYLPFESEFSHRFACWAINHRGWAKMKRYNRKVAKRRIRQKEKATIQNGDEDNAAD